MNFRETGAICGNWDNSCVEQFVINTAYYMLLKAVYDSKFKILVFEFVRKVRVT